MKIPQDVPMICPGISLGFRACAALTSLALGIAVSGCASTTTILSTPPGARVYLNGEPAGNTPMTMTDTKIVGSVTAVRLELPGYDPLDGVIVRNEDFDVGACIGGVLLLFPFLWIMAYKPVHNFELRPSGAGYSNSYPMPPNGPPTYYIPPAPQQPPPKPAPGAPRR